MATPTQTQPPELRRSFSSTNTRAPTPVSPEEAKANQQAANLIHEGYTIRNKLTEILADKNYKTSTAMHEDAFQQFHNLLEKLKNALNLAPRFFPAYLAQAYFLLDEIMIFEDADGLTKTEKDSAYRGALEAIESSAKFRNSDNTMWLLWAAVAVSKAVDILKSSGNISEYENLLVTASEKLLKILEADDNDPSVAMATKLLSICNKQLTSGQKDRQRTGKAIYHIAGEFTKEGGSHKSWKTRWFVVDDSSISYYTDKAAWEAGPVIGAPSKTKGAILFSDLLDVTSHGDQSKCTNIKDRPKNLSSGFCLHLLTQKRTYNIIGFDSEKQSSQWVTALKAALKTYNMKKRAKKFLREKTGGSAIGAALVNMSATKSEFPTAPSVNSPEFSDFIREIMQKLFVDVKKSLSEIHFTVTRSLSDENNNNNNNSLKKSMKNIDISNLTLIQNEQEEFSMQDLRNALQNSDNETAQVYLKALLKEYQAEGRLAKLIYSMAKAQPKQFCLNLADTSKFEVAQFGALPRLERIITQQDEEDEDE